MGELRTKSGRYVIYHRDEAPEAYAHPPSDGPWYWRPLGWDSPYAFSEGSATQDLALQRAEVWEARVWAPAAAGPAPG